MKKTCFAFQRVRAIRFHPYLAFIPAENCTRRTSVYFFFVLFTFLMEYFACCLMFRTILSTKHYNFRERTPAISYANCHNISIMDGIEEQHRMMRVI